MRSWTALPFLLAASAALLAQAFPASAHEVHREVRWGRSVAVRAGLADGASLADAQAEVYSPADAATPYWKGRTDRGGWVAFVPDVPGAWRVRIVDSTGHGIDTTVDVPAGLGSDVPVPGESTPGPGALAFLLRPVVGVALVVAVFGGLFLLRRRP